ncbi:NUDIX hydrolase [Streptacidiphilus sp. PB12-B1b]|uniref:NUDIX hydrolase n=1 Tax=Streptacidiphilus sp. PB12-B1b TaxID=2705012 RepID=UPI0015FD48EC|nr:NUDIX domain-containing protein [Streptacidiphilus sp. PB12-B1b]QMU77509.1 NUDIX hydrolase [Streptacidiphilus sp. PB12-B1b]
MAPQPDAPPVRPDERDWLAAYDPRAYPPIAVCVDIVALTMRHGRLHVLLVHRAAPPYRGSPALPGGFVRAGEEDLGQAAARELAEETGVDPTELHRVHLEQLGSYGSPARDPRMHVVSVAYLAFAPDLPDPRAGGDAASAAWTPVAGPRGGGSGDRAPLHLPGSPPGALPDALAFDHAAILADALDRARAKVEYTPLATAFLEPEFTIPELRAVYEEIWGEPLHAGNFHRKVLSVPGFVVATGRTTTRGGPRGGPRARLYRAGAARTLHPALLRPGTPDDLPDEPPPLD